MHNLVFLVEGWSSLVASFCRFDFFYSSSLVEEVERKSVKKKSKHFFSKSHSFSFFCPFRFALSLSVSLSSDAPRSLFSSSPTTQPPCASRPSSSPPPPSPASAPWRVSEAAGFWVASLFQALRRRLTFFGFFFLFRVSHVLFFFFFPSISLSLSQRNLSSSSRSSPGVRVEGGEKREREKRTKRGKQKGCLVVLKRAAGVASPFFFKRLLTRGRNPLVPLFKNLYSPRRAHRNPPV